jgi:hypothetical protein
MEENTSFIPMVYTDAALTSIAPAGEPTAGVCTRHFTQTEDFFLKLDFDYLTPRFRFHHDIARNVPDDDYLQALGETLRLLSGRLPEVFGGLTYFFDPQELFKPSFFKLYECHGSLFLYLLRLDLGFRPNYQTIVECGDNDLSHICRSDCLFLEPLLIPLVRFETEGGAARAVVKSLISQTWIGEYGRGFFRQGIWMDNDLTKFFTRLFVPPERRPYPLFPFQCNYRTFCAMPVRFTAAVHLAAAAALGEALAFIEPSLPEIQRALKLSVFSEDLPVFRELKAAAGLSIGAAWDTVSVRTYLNKNGLKEYQLEEPAPAQ